MSATPRFTLFGPAHLTVLFLTFALPSFLAWVIRRPGGERVALVLFFLCYLPFAVADRLRRHRSGMETA